MLLCQVLEIALFIGILYLTSAVLSYTQNFSMTTISNKFAKVLRTKISKKITNKKKDIHSII